MLGVSVLFILTDLGGVRGSSNKLHREETIEPLSLLTVTYGRLTSICKGSVIWALTSMTIFSLKQLFV